MNDILNRDVDPCLDLYTYVCWIWKEGGPGYSSFLEDQRRTAKNALHDYLMTVGERSATVQAITTVYHGCLQHFNRTMTPRQIATDLLDTLDIDVTSWGTMSLISLVRPLVALSVIYELPSVFSIELRGDYTFAIAIGKTIRDISASEYSLDKLTSHTRTMVEAITGVQFVDESVEALMKLDDGLHEAMKYLDGPQSVPVQDLCLGNVTGDEWAQSFTAIEPRHCNVTLETEVAITGLSNLRDIFSILETTDASIRALYLIVLLTSDTIRYEYYERFVEAENLNSSNIICAGLVSQLFPNDYASLEAFVLMNDTKTKEAENLFRQGGSALLSVLAHDNRWNKAKYENAMNILSSITFKTFAPMEPGGSTKATSRNTFIGNIFEVKEKMAVSRIQDGVNHDDTQQQLAAMQWAGEFAYVKKLNTIVVASQNMIPNYLYDRDHSELLNYGTVLASIVREMLAALPSHLYDQEKCGAASDRNFGAFLPSEKAEVLRLAKTARVAYRAFRNHLDLWPLLADEEVAADRIFFQRFCLTFCSHILLEKRPALLQMRHRCELPLLYMPEFRRAFGCMASNQIHVCPPTVPSSLVA